MYLKSKVRRFVSFLKGTLIWLIPALGFVLFTGRTSEASNFHFLNGYWYFVNSQFGGCAEEIPKANIPKEDPLYSRSELYLAYCQYKLGYHQAAAYHLIEVDQMILNSEDRALYTDLRYHLPREIEKITEFHILAYPYYGLKSYSSNLTKSGGQFYGIYTELLYKQISVIAGVERLQINFFSSASYTHTQFQGGIQWNPNLSFVGALKFFQISPDNSSLASVSTPELSFTYYPNEHFGFGFDSSYSLYQNSSFGRLTVAQFILDGLFRIYSDQKYAAWLSLGTVAILPSGSVSTDPLTSYTLLPYYYRFPVTLNLTLDHFEWTLQGWMGKEVFGFRPRGSIFYIAPEEHDFGVNTSLRYSDKSGKSTWGIQVLYMYESVQAIGNPYADHTFAATIFFEI